MACMGPDYKAAKKQADEAFEDIIKLLKEKYHVSSPENHEGYRWRFKLVEEHYQVELWMKECVEKLFEIDASDSF